MTTILRAEAAHDFLALVPALAGYAPERSLVCVAFRGNRTAGLIRHDLPGRSVPRADLADLVVGTLCRMSGVDALVPIAYVPGGFRTRSGGDARRLVEAVADRAATAGFDVRDALVVARDGWGSTRDPATPAAGHPLAMIGSSAAGAAAEAQDAVGRRVDDAAVLPEPDPKVRSLIRRTLSTIADAAAARAGIEGRAPAAPFAALVDALGDRVDPVRLIETVVAEAPSQGEGAERPPAAGRVDGRALAWLLHLASVPAWRDAMMLQVAFGEGVGEAAVDDAVRMNERCRRSGRSMDDLVRGDLRTGGTQSEPLVRLMLGLVRTRPDVGRVERGLAVLREAIAHAPADRVAGACCMAAWLAWSLGRGSAAAMFLDRAAAAEPRHTMTELLHTYFGSGALPEWAFDAD